MAHQFADAKLALRGAFISALNQGTRRTDDRGSSEP
jgi:hypothetical protein